MVHELTETQIVDEGQGGPLNQDAHAQAEEAEETNREEREKDEGEDDKPEGWYDTPQVEERWVRVGGVP